MATPATMIEHVAAVEPEAEPEPAASLPMEAPSVMPAPESAAVRREREQVEAWIRNRLIDYPLASCLLCRKPIIAGRIGRKRRTARRERGSIALVTPNGVLSGKRRHGRRSGSRAEPFRS